MLEQYPFLDGIMKGEGEITFRELAVYYQNQENGTEGKTLEEIHGITYRDAEGAIKSNPWRPVMDLSEVDFPYANLKKFENRIIYYESSRGCPFSCSYCLSSIDKRLRFRNLDLVKRNSPFPGTESTAGQICGPYVQLQERPCNGDLEIHCGA